MIGQKSESVSPNTEDEDTNNKKGDALGTSGSQFGLLPFKDDKSVRMMDTLGKMESSSLGGESQPILFQPDENIRIEDELLCDDGDHKTNQLLERPDLERAPVKKKKKSKRSMVSGGDRDCAERSND